MKQIKCIFLVFVAMLFFESNSYAQKEFVQRILLDKPVTAGPLKVFPLLDDPNNYYYLPNKVRLGTDDVGRPQFSFIHFVENISSGASDDVADIGNGGGYVHLMVGLIVTPEELEEAKRELQKINPRGKITGPVIYRGGTMALINKSVITNSMDPDGVTRVLGIGPAPVLEGDKVAVSFLLNKDDAVILSESLKSPNPDVSFNLSMTLAGYQSPVEFKIEMEWDKVYQHNIFNAGVATPILQAEIEVAIQELRETGAIKVTQIGEDENLQKLQDVLVNKMIDLCFVPFGGENSPNWASLGKPMNNGVSYLDKATKQLNDERQRQRQGNERIAQRNQTLAQQQPRQPNTGANNNRPANNQQTNRETSAGTNRQTAGTGQTERQANAGANRQAAETQSNRQGQGSEQAGAETEATTQRAASQQEGSTSSEITEEGRAAAEESVEDASTGELLQGMERPERTTRPDNVDAGRSVLNNPANIRPANEPIPDFEPQVQREEPEPLQMINIVASFQSKTIKHSGKYVAEAKSYFTTSLTETFGGNIGKINCKDCIREINLASPLYTQREIVAFIDGEISQDFDKFINYVTVSMRKQHPGGAITTKEVRVDRKNFNAEGNRFKLLYGWMPGDNDRKTWLDYEYKTIWNFFGGATVESDWAKSANPVIPLKAPVKRKTINVIAEQDAVKDLGIRSVTVRVYYKIAGGEEQFKQTSLNVSKQVLNETIDFILPREVSEYEYEVDWLLKNNQVKKSGRQKTSFDDLYVDVLPE